MSTVKVVLYKYRSNKNGEFPLYLRIIKDRKPKYITLGIDLDPKHWDEDKSRVKKSYPNSQRVNNFIAQKVAETEAVALEMEADNKYTSPKKIKEAVMGKSSESFLKYFEAHVAELEKSAKMGSHDKALAVLYKLRTFLKKKDLLFDEITVQFLKTYEKYLKNDLGNSVNTIYSNLKIFRKLINDAINEDIIPYEKNPFHKFKLKTEKTEKVFLTEDELTAIEDLELVPGTMRYHHRNIYILAAYTGGLRISDILQLRWENFDGERFLVNTQKTSSVVSIKLPAKSLEIVKLYEKADKKPKDYIFPFLGNEVDSSNPKKLFDAISSHTAYTNKDLKVIGELAGIEKHIHFHTSRHTWATRALKKGMRIEYVSKLMGHNSIKTTQVYAKIVNEELDKAMEVFN